MLDGGLVDTRHYVRGHSDTPNTEVGVKYLVLCLRGGSFPRTESKVSVTHLFGDPKFTVSGIKRMKSVDNSIRRRRKLDVKGGKWRWQS